MHDVVKWYNVGPPISALRRTDPVHPPKPPGRKDRARWCKGKVGREHDWVVTIPMNTDSFFLSRPCGYVSYTRIDGSGWSTWLCKHRVVCSTCGRVRRRATQSECDTGVLDPD